MQRNKMKYSAAPKGNMENTVYIYTYPSLI